MAGSATLGADARPRWLTWTLWCGFAEVIGMVAAAGAAVIGTRLVGEPQTYGAAALVLAVSVMGGAIEGVAVGGIQYRLLKPWLIALSARRFVGVTVSVAVVAWLLGMLPSTIASLASTSGQGAASATQPPVVLIIFGGALGGAFAGALFGGAQAWALRGVVTRPSTWVLANVCAWTLAMALIMIGATTPDETWPVERILVAGAVTGLVAGSVLGAVTGAFIPRLVPVPGTQEPEVVAVRPAAADPGAPH